MEFKGIANLPGTHPGAQESKDARRLDDRGAPANQQNTETGACSPGIRGESAIRARLGGFSVREALLHQSEEQLQALLDNIDETLNLRCKEFQLERSAFPEKFQGKQGLATIFAMLDKWHAGNSQEGRRAGTPENKLMREVAAIIKEAMSQIMIDRRPQEEKRTEILPAELVDCMASLIALRRRLPIARATGRYQLEQRLILELDRQKDEILANLDNLKKFMHVLSKDPYGSTTNANKIFKRVNALLTRATYTLSEDGIYDTVKEAACVLLGSRQKNTCDAGYKIAIKIIKSSEALREERQFEVLQLIAEFVPFTVNKDDLICALLQDAEKLDDQKKLTLLKTLNRHLDEFEADEADGADGALQMAVNIFNNLSPDQLAYSDWIELRTKFPECQSYLPLKDEHGRPSKELNEELKLVEGEKKFQLLQLMLRDMRPIGDDTAGLIMAQAEMLHSEQRHEVLRTLQESDGQSNQLQNEMMLQAPGRRHKNSCLVQ
jgi:hypothetical protein